MADGTPQALPQAAPTGAAPGAGESQQMQQLLQRLLQHVAQPRMAGPQPPPQAEKSLQTPEVTPHMMTRGVLGLVHDLAVKSKKTQLDHATQRIKGISDAITDAYEMAQGDPQKAQQIFMASPAVQALQSKEGQKDIKQMEKLLQYDFLNPEKSKTVWHEALEKVAKLSGAEKTMKGIRTLIGQHKDKMAEEVRKQGEAQKGAQGGRDLASAMFRGASPEQIDPSKLLPSLVSSTGADARAREREIFQDYERQQKQNFAASIDAIKDPRQKMLARASEAMMEGSQADAQKYIEQASKLYAAGQKPGQPSLFKAIDDAVNNPDADKRAAAQRDIDKYLSIQTDLLTKRGMSFGMGRLYNWYNSETGQTTAMNGFQAQAAMQQGGQWIMTNPVSTQMLLPAQQIVRSMLVPSATGKTLRQDLVDDMAAFDNADDRAIISRVLRENPSVYASDPSTLGTWLDQNLTGQLSPGGQKLVRDVKLYAEVFNRTASLTGQTRTEMNTMLMLALLPNERTPNRNYGMKQLEASFNYLDSVVQAPLLGGGKFTGTPKATDKKDDKKSPTGRTIPLD